MNNKGFSLVDLLLSLAMFGVVLIIGLCASHDMLKTSLIVFRSVSDEEVFNAAKNYVDDNNMLDGNSYACVTVRDLVNYGYLADTNDYQLKNRIVKLKKDNITTIIYNVEYVNNCD